MPRPSVAARDYWEASWSPSIHLPSAHFHEHHRGTNMDGLKLVEVVSQNPNGISEILGLRGDGALFRGQVTIDREGVRVSILWTRITEEMRPG